MNHSLTDKLRPLLERLGRGRFAIFTILCIAVFGYVGWQVYAAVTVPPDSAASSSANPSATPHIDPATVNKIRQLQDNSVQVRALFDQARQNPFQE